MQGIYECIVELLGQKSDSLVLKRLSHALAEEAVFSGGRQASTFRFPNNGIILLYDSSRGFSTASFWLPPSRVVRDGEMKAYCGDLPVGVCASDSKEEVRQKAGVEPFRSYYLSKKDEEYRYDLRSARVTFHFDENSDMSLVSVRALPEPEN